MIRLKFKKMSFTVVCALLLGASTVAIQQPIAAFAGTDSQADSLSISDILKYQNADGGWSKGYNKASGTWKNTTIDNGYTYSEIRRLASEYSKTKNSTYSKAAIKGINCLLDMQYANGGWPQIHNGSDYHKHITYNDNAMINVMILLDEIANKKGDFSFVDSNLANKCKNSVNKGVDCILKTQVKVNGQLTVWGQQHDSVTLAPAAARAYELPSLCSSESVAIVNFLKTRPRTAAIDASINAATTWFNQVKITGTKVVKTETGLQLQKDSKASPIWARFYEIGTNKPIFVNRQSQKFYDVTKIEVERQLGYAWYGNWGSKLK